MGEIVGIEITSAQIDRFISAFQYLVQWMILAFDLIENDFRDMLVESADLVLLVNEILDVVVTAVEAIASVSEYVPLEDATEKITAMKDDMIILAEAMVLALEELAKGLKDAIPVAGEVAGDVGDILDVVTPAIEALAGIADYVSLADAQSKIDSFKDDLLLVADALIEALSDLAGRLEESLAAAALVAGSVVSVLEVIGPAIDGLIALGDYKGIANLRTKLGTFTFQFEEAVFDLAFSLDVLNQRLGEKIATAATVAEAATGIFDGVQTAVDALNSLAELKTSSVKKQMDYLVAQSQMIVDALTNPAPIGSDVVQAASDFAANIAALVVAVQDALDSINELVNSNVDGSLQGILDDLVELMAETAVPAGQAGAAIGDAFGQGLLNALSSLVSGVLAAVQGIVAALGSGNSGAYAAGQNLGNSFASGLYSRLSLVAAAARALASQAEASIRTELQIFSPSKVATRLAESFVEGFEAPFLTPLSFATAFSPFTAAATVGTGYAQSQQNISGDTIYLDIKLENGGPVAPQTVEQLTNIIQNVIDKNGRDAYIQRRTLR
jgi:hypothetical protein